MFEKVKEWCEYELNNVEKHGYDTHGAITRCYGIVMFVSNSLVGYESEEGKKIGKWWDDEMLPHFREMYDRG